MLDFPNYAKKCASTIEKSRVRANNGKHDGKDWWIMVDNILTQNIELSYRKPTQPKKRNRCRHFSH